MTFPPFLDRFRHELFVDHSKAAQVNFILCCFPPTIFVYRQTVTYVLQNENSNSPYIYSWFWSVQIWTFWNGTTFSQATHDALWTCRLVKWTYGEWWRVTPWTQQWTSCSKSVMTSSSRLLCTSFHSCLLHSKDERVKIVDSQIALFCRFHMDHYGLIQSSK